MSIFTKPSDLKKESKKNLRISDVKVSDKKQESELTKLKAIVEAAKDYLMLFDYIDLDTLVPFDEKMDVNEFRDDWCEKAETLDILLYPHKERYEPYD